MTQPGIYIIGAGAIGKALAVFLKSESRNVILVRGSTDDQPTVESSIEVVNQDNRHFSEKIKITTFSNLDCIHGIVLITVKTFANGDIARKLKNVKGDFSIVLLQNGLNIESPFENFKNVYRCVLFSTSQVQNNNQVTFKTVTASPVGNLRGENTGLDALLEQINTPFFTFRKEPDILRYVWEKVIINCAFNSICPLLETDNGIFFRNQHAGKLAESVISECVTLAKKYKIVIDQNKIAEKLMMISERSNGQLISTYEDIRKKRRTEINSLNLEISRLAENAGVPELVTNTRLLGQMIKIKSELVINEYNTNK